MFHLDESFKILKKEIELCPTKHAQEIYQAAFNNTREETAHKVAWAAVKRDYERD